MQKISPYRKPNSGVFKSYSDVLKPYSGIFLQFMELKSLKLDFHIDFFPHQTYPLTNRDLKTRDASFQHCFETWQLTKFFDIYCYLERVFPFCPLLGFSLLYLLSFFAALFVLFIKLKFHVYNFPYYFLNSLEMLNSLETLLTNEIVSKMMLF